MLRAVASAVLLALSPSTASAQGYPNKLIRVVIGYAPGGSADAGVRPPARAMEPLLGQSLIIENKPGNAGGVAMDFIVKALPDGYTLYYFDSGPLTVAPHMGKVGYRSVTSFTHLGHVCGSGSLLVVHEAGVKGFDSTAWYGLLGPAGLPAEAVTRLTQALAKAGADKTLRDQINATGCDTGILSAAQTVEKIRADYAKWGRAVKEANIKAE